MARRDHHNDSSQIRGVLQGEGRPLPSPSPSPSPRSSPAAVRRRTGEELRGDVPPSGRTVLADLKHLPRSKSMDRLTFSKTAAVLVNVRLVDLTFWSGARRSPDQWEGQRVEQAEAVMIIFDPR